MTKLVLPDAVSGFNLQVINDNFQKIEEELQNKVLYRDNPVGEANALMTDIDANGSRIYNLPEPTLASEAARLQDVMNGVSGNAANLISNTPSGTIAADTVQGAINELDTNITDLSTSVTASLTTLDSEKVDLTALAADNGSCLVGFNHTAPGSVSRTVQDKELDIVSVLDFMTTAQRADVRTNAATLDVQAPLQLAANHGDMPLPNGTMLIKNSVVFEQPVSMVGRGAKSVVKIAADFGSNAAFVVSPVGAERRNWQFENFQVTNAGTAATNVFLLDIADAGQYLNKLRVKGVIADAVTGNFVELLNSIPNADGLFTSVFEDNWSLNGYYLDNIGDSMIFQRNTTSGAGRGYYVNQLPGASHIIIRDGNCTSPGGVLVANAFNLTIDQMQFECSTTYTGTGTGFITLQNVGTPEISNIRLTNNNINTHGTTNPTLACVYLNVCAGAEVEGNTLMTNSATGAHIIIGGSSRDVYIGPNKYYNQSGVEIAPMIQDSGVGTMGIWKPTVPATWATSNMSFYKDKEGTVHLRGSMSGAASAIGQVLCTLPVGFRPAIAQTLVASYSGALAPIQISTAGVVIMTAAAMVSVCVDGISFSTKA